MATRPARREAVLTAALEAIAGLVAGARPPAAARRPRQVPVRPADVAREGRRVA